MAATPPAVGFSPAIPSLSPPAPTRQKPICFFLPFCTSNKNPTAGGLSWSLTGERNPLCSRISHTAGAPRKHHAYKKLAVVCGLMSGSSETDAEFEQNNLNTDATIDIQLPRRSLLVKFTCDLCGERTDRLVNRLAYDRGLVYVQCAGSLKYHKLVDNLGLVVEYDLRDDMDTDADKV